MWDMTIVDERAHVPPLDAGALDRLARAFDRDGVVAAMLIGSQARGSAGPLSDIDIGVWHEPGLDPAARLELRLELAAAVAGALGTDEVDIVLLNGATPLMRHRAIRDARRLVERDSKARVRLESRAILDYLDTKPLRAELARGLRHRLEEDRFGRR
ncbi:MAG: nucleotidyltransferase domain-containing protein [Solirubrobacterales bacterium]|nr:nucleotidyltransferase domain-containing protein [Solirubrobacterales bacterium]